MKKALPPLLLIFILLGCGATTGLIQKNEQESLSKSADLYYKLIMWKYYEKAARFVDPEKHKQYERFVLNNQKDLNITGYDIKEMNYITEDKPEGNDKEKEVKECEVRVLFTYYKYPSVSEKSVMVEDKWVRRGQYWYVSDFNEGSFK